MIYTVTFNPAIDYVVKAEKLTLGTVNRADAELIQFGGKGINVSAVLKSLGTESVALGFVAGFTGAELENKLNQAGVKTDFIRLNSGMTRINIKIKAECETEINGKGPDIPNSALNELFEKLDRLIAGDCLVLAGSIPKTLPDDIYEQIMARLAGKNVNITVDAEGALLCNVLKYKPFLIKPNSIELGAIFGKELKTIDEISECAVQLQKQGAQNVLVSMAGDGALLIDKEGKTHRITAPKGTVKNSVGAGDSMIAGFIAGWLEKGDCNYALRLGTAAGSATAFSDGLATKEEVYRLLETI